MSEGTPVVVIDDAALLASIGAPEPVNAGDDGRWGDATPITALAPLNAAGGWGHVIDPADDGLPRNATTGEAYRGGNVARLLAAEIAAGYVGHEWAGFKQWLKAGRVVRKGEHGTSCKTVIHVTNKKGKAATTCRGFTVFHRDQTDELTEEAGA